MSKLLNLSNNVLGIDGMNMLQTAIAGDSFTNLRRLMLENCFTRDTPDNVHSMAFSKFVGAISAHCPHLCELDLSQNNLGVTGAVELARMNSQHNKLYSDQQNWLCRVNLTRTKLGDKGLCAFFEVLDCTWYFDLLSLGGNDISDTGLGYLVQAIASWKVVFTESAGLTLEENSLGYKGLTEMVKLLSIYNIQLEQLNLSRCQLTDPLTFDRDVCNQLLIGQQLCQMPRNNTLTGLYLDGNKFTGDGIHILAGLMHLCPSLEKLSTKDCAISSSDFSRLLDVLLRLELSSDICCKLRWWFLCSNKIDDKGVSAFIQRRSWSLFPGLAFDSLVLDDYPISDEMTETLYREWWSRKDLKVRNCDIIRFPLASNIISHACATFFYRVMKISALGLTAIVKATVRVKEQ